MNTLIETQTTAPPSRLQVVRLTGPDGRWAGFDIEVVAKPPRADSVAL